MVIPASLVTKETASWDDLETTDSLGNSVTSALWTLKYEFRGAASVSLTAATNGTGWRTSTLVSSFTVAGTYYWQALLTKGSPTVTDRILLNSGKLFVKANLTDATALYDASTQAEQDLAAVQAAMRAIVSGGAVKSYTIGNRSLTKMEMSDLIVLESKLKAEVAQEKKAATIAAGLGNPNNLFVRFRR